MEIQNYSPKTQTIGIFTPVGFIIAELAKIQYGKLEYNTPIILEISTAGNSSVCVIFDEESELVTINYIN